MRLSLLTLLVWCCVPHLLAGAESSPVRLFKGDKELTLPESAQPEVERQILALVQSSNFHSGPDDKVHVFTARGVQQDYRDVVASGEYLLLVLSPAEKIHTVGGEIIAAEVVVGLRGSGGRSIVFTIDDAGTVMSHAKYAGPVYLELKKTVTAARD